MTTFADMTIVETERLIQSLVKLTVDGAEQIPKDDLDTLTTCGLISQAQPSGFTVTHLGCFVLVAWFHVPDANRPVPFVLAKATGPTKGSIDYPVDLFDSLIAGNSPYAFYMFQWVPYQTEASRWRLKMFHDAKTFDGREALGVWPNGSSVGPFKDEEVEFIRISKNQHTHQWKDPRKLNKELPS